MSDFVFEIFSEELPATLQKKIAFDYKIFAGNELKKNGVNGVSDLFVGITLNRLVLYVKNCIISDEQLKKFINSTLKGFSKTFPRTMNYPQLEVRWIRPIRSIFACIDDNVIIDDFCGIKSKNGTFLEKFNFVECKSVKEYFNVLKEEEIEIDYNKRLEFVKKEIYNEDKEGTFDDYWNGIGKQKYLKLAEEIAGMSEYCIEPIKCYLADDFYLFPFELIELVLRENQRYVVFCKKYNNGDIIDGKLVIFGKIIYFLIFGDKITKDTQKRESIKKGHQKVVNARLNDALFYWKMDNNKIKELGLEKYKSNLKETLSSRIFVDNITWGEYLKEQEKVLQTIVKMIGEKKEHYSEDEKGLKIGLYKSFTERLIWDTKLDLVTNVVAEFPELQGIIGGYYFDYGFNPYVLNFDEILKISKEKENALSFGKIPKEIIENDYIGLEYFCYYIVDKIVYIKTMYEQGKQPTGSGDKYKVKSRVDDIIEIIDSVSIIKECIWKYLKEQNFYDLLIKRYNGYVEARLDKVFDNKSFKDICKKYWIDEEALFVFSGKAEKSKKYWIDGEVLFVFSGNAEKNAEKKIELCKKWFSYFKNKEFIKTYKRIHGYTGGEKNNCNKESEINEDVKKKIYELLVIGDLKKQFNDNDCMHINYYLNNHDDLNNDDYKNLNNYLDKNKIADDKLVLIALDIIERKYFKPYLPEEFLEIA